MSKRNRIFVGILLAYVFGVSILLWRLLADIDPRYRQSAEDSLVETAYLLAAQIEERSAHGLIEVDSLRPVFRSLYAQSIHADLYGVLKTRIDLRVTVVDRQGTVLFDSLGRQEGSSLAGWRDISLTLKGEYGARTTADVPGEPSTSVMYVSAPIKADSAVIGVVTVAKPVESLGPFVAAAQYKTLQVGIASVAAVLFLAVILSVWLVRPFGAINDYIQFVRAQRRLSLPILSRRALGAFGAAFEDMRDALAGRTYVADYVQTLTHELKSPLSAIRGAAELLQGPMAEPDRLRFIGNIARETQRIQELVDRMMELAALESRRQLDRTVPVSLNAVLAELVASAEAAGAPRQICVCLQASQTAWVDGDALLLRRAIGSLLDNAIDFSPQGGTVVAALTVGKRSAEISVRDQGAGIPDYAGDKVFEKFYSLARPQSQRKSTGLGLPFVKQVAKLHRGEVSLRNAESGSGAIAVMSLPLSTEPMPAE